MCNDLDWMFKPLVLITGFGPFSGHSENASWEGVKLINKEEIENKHNIELVQLEIPVTYENVDEFVPALWETHTPKLTIHVGVSGVAKHLTIETQAHKKGYQRLDYFEKCPANHVNPSDGAFRLQTKLNVERICYDFNSCLESTDKMKVVSSKDAGRYLCEYIYYTSLSVDSSRTLFVHVPTVAVYSSTDTARGLEKILNLCLEQIREIDASSKLTDNLKNVTLTDGDDNEV